MTVGQEQQILTTFGLTALRAGQRELLEQVLAGQNALGVLPTGQGKSLIYQAAAQLLGGLTVVVSPLIALMRDQCRALTALGMTAARFDSSLEQGVRAQVLDAAAEGSLRLLYVAPEALQNSELDAALRRSTLMLFVVDEAHCVSEWGHSFRPDYLLLPAWQRRYGFRSVLALTATATPRVQADLCAAFNIAPASAVILPPARPNIKRRVLCVSNRLQALLDFLPEHQPAIVYCRTRKETEALAGVLQQRGLTAAGYHAGLNAETRAELQDAFLRNERTVLVATIAFGMGVDKPDVRSVIHYSAPSSPESYVQESGRAGRDGKQSYSLVLLNSDDLVDARNRIAAAEPDAEGVQRAVRWLMPTCRRVVSLWELITACDVPEDVVTRTLHLLMSEGVVEIEARGYKMYKLKPLFPLNTILDGREPDERARLQWLDTHREGETEEAAEAWHCSFAEAMEQLRECEAAGEWRLSFCRRVLSLHTLRPERDAREVAAELSASYARRRKADTARMETLLQMLRHPDTLDAMLHDYFTEEQTAGSQTSELSLPPREAVFSPPPPATELPKFDREQQRRRFLLGLNSPGSMSRRLWNHPLYGCCSGAAWDELT